MKNILLLILPLCTIFGYEQASNSELKFFENKTNSSFHLFGDTLVGLEIVNPDESDPYKKYGFEFGGHCYGCDLADILITSNGISLINSCQTGDKKEYEQRMLKNGVNRLVIVTEKADFIFEKIEKVRVYRLTIEGDAEQHKDLRLIEYYTPKSELFKFEIHDCGEFDG